MGWGNKISAKNESKSKRLFQPNWQKTSLYSETLDKKIRLDVTTHALKLIDACGGLDNYLLRTPDKNLHSDVASDLKFQIGLVQKQRAYESWLRKREDQGQPMYWNRLSTFCPPVPEADVKSANDKEAKEQPHSFLHVMRSRKS